MFTPKRAVAVVGLAAAALVATACSGGTSEPAGSGDAAAPSGGTITIAAPLALTGSAGSVGLEVRNGAELAIEEINAAGGIGGRELVLNAQDTAGDPAQAVQVVSSMSRDADTIALLGPLLTPEVAAVYNSIAETGIVMIPPASLGAIPGVEGGEFNDWTFRVNQPLQYVATPLIVKAIEETDAKKVTVLGLSDNPTNKEIADWWEEGAKGAGVEVQRIDFPNATTDFSAIATSIAPDSDVIAFSTLPSHTASLTALLRQSGHKAQFLGETAMLSHEVWDNSGGATLGAFAYSPFLPDANDRAKAFTEAFTEKYDLPPSLFSALGYESIYLIAEAADENVTRDSLREGLSTLSGFEGVTGTLGYDGSGDVLRGEIPFVHIIDGGGVEKIGEIVPENAG
ncbi:ABC transporter substrate-binding protein [Microbacterium sp. No. 7]|uniref:ABC transporter substrate-binding protein n=1 Tax=Microbacterium sp. No. 7 TaxID=1714373 RepID=UPI000B152D14|nr:ABC transporter substrate-binding protein [Microbacterium sp. No. 7]